MAGSAMKNIVRAHRVIADAASLLDALAKSLNQGGSFEGDQVEPEAAKHYYACQKSAADLRALIASPGGERHDA